MSKRKEREQQVRALDVRDHSLNTLLNEIRAGTFDDVLPRVRKGLDERLDVLDVDTEDARPYAQLPRRDLVSVLNTAVENLGDVDETTVILAKPDVPGSCDREELDRLYRVVQEVSGTDRVLVVDGVTIGVFEVPERGMVLVQVPVSTPDQGLADIEARFERIMPEGVQVIAVRGEGREMRIGLTNPVVHDPGDVYAAEREIKRLAAWILANDPAAIADTDPERGASAVDVAIRLLERVEGLRAAAEDMLRFGAHDGECEPFPYPDDAGAEWDTRCQHHVGATERRAAALREALGGE